uniref:Uncharacterized protein n=1 Tax=Oryza sativa subsp. japonica TaxID=39947 RepID=Q6EQH0_ORYSJ|nr:hypothetical protein [Oryza sativa Japonica Group]
MTKSTNHEDEENSRRRQTQPTDVDEDNDVGDPVDSNRESEIISRRRHSSISNRVNVRANEAEVLVMMSVTIIHQIGVIAVADASLGGK